jgi:hypothetical protein
MSLVSIIEPLKFHFNCFCGEKDSKLKNKYKNKFIESIHEHGQAYNITVIPVQVDFEIDNIYPETNQVDKWNIIIIGRDKTFVHVHLYDLVIPDAENFVNNRAGSVLNRELRDFFDPVFENTLAGQQLQFIMGWLGNIHLVNTYPIKNQNNMIIGAILFIRNYMLLPKLFFEKKSTPLR